MKIAFVLFVLAALVCCSQSLSLSKKITKAGKASCSIAVNGGLPDPQPLLLKPGGSNDGYGFYLPANSAGRVEIEDGGTIRIACPGTSNYIVPLGSGVQEANAVCVGGTEFTANGGSYSFREFFCSSNPYHTARVSPTNELCSNGFIIEIGFIVGTDFFKTLDICYDDTLRNTNWSKFQLVAGIGGYQSGFPSPSSFATDTFYPGIDVATKYTRNGQRATVSSILGSTALGNQYISQSDDYFMSRGHMTAKADFVYGAQHRATYHYINVAPQWQTFNGGNWNQMEQDVRLFAGTNQLDLIVYTGTNGVTTLPDVNGVQQEIWLSVDSNNNKAIPAPKLFWKVVYNPATEEAIAFLGVNNPYIPAPDASYFICPDVCDNGEVSWLKWSKDNVKLGVSYCCAVDDVFRAAVKTLPDFNVSGLLTK